MVPNTGMMIGMMGFDINQVNSRSNGSFSGWL
jgi:hypothetical protein